MQNKNDSGQDDLLPDNFSSFESFWEFWDTHSSADYEDLMETVELNVELSSSKIYYAIEKNLVSQLQTQALRQGISTETLVNLWLQEKISTLSKNQPTPRQT